MADLLREQRATPEPAELEGLRQRVLARRALRGRRLPRVRSRVVTILTVLGLAAGTGGAFAIAGFGSGGAHGLAAKGQYCPPKSKVKHGKCIPIKHHHHHHHHHHHGNHHHHHH